VHHLPIYGRLSAEPASKFLAAPKTIHFNSQLEILSATSVQCVKENEVIAVTYLRDV